MEACMAKCERCGKGGIFSKLEPSGLCGNCDRIVKLEFEEASLKKEIAERKSELSEVRTTYKEIYENKEKLFSEISDQAKEAGLLRIADQVAAAEGKVLRLDLERERKSKDLESLTEQINTAEKALERSGNKLRNIQTVYKSMLHAAKKYFEEYSPSAAIIADNNIEIAEELLSTTIKMKFHLMDVRELRKRYRQNEKLINDLLVRYQDRYTTKANISIYRLMVIALEAELQNILYNLSYSKLDKAIDDVKKTTAKYQTIASEGNQNIAPTVAKFIGEIEYLFIEAIRIEYEYYIQKERAKEEQRAIRETMRQEAVERKKLEAERKKVEQEEAKFEAEITNIKELMALSPDQERIRQLEERLYKVQEQLNSVEKKKEDIINLQNGKAGYIYVISNLGSFGDNVFKIGMTRRLEPQERVDELGGASVPFNFDVHSFIFSDSAPDLEYKLHRHLHEKRVNRVNLRKEFFRSSIDELEELVYSLEPTAEFKRTMLAEQYYQSMAVEEIPDESEVFVGIDEDDSEEDDGDS